MSTKTIESDIISRDNTSGYVVGSPEFVKATMRRVTWRLIPYLILAYILNFIDRVNLGFAALQMNQELAFSATVFGYGAGILFIGYFVFGVPSNLILHRIGARIWIGVLLAAWGLVSACMVFTHNETSFYVIRFILGATEAGFFPGVVLYLSYWYPRQRLGYITAQFMFAMPLSMMIGSVISGALLQMDGTMGLAGWRWMFLLEGLPAFLCGLFGIYYLTDKPANASWLSKDQKEWLQSVLDRETAEAKQAESAGSQKQEGFLSAIMDWRVLVLGLIYLTYANGVYGINMWLPQIIKTFGNLTDTQIGLVSAIPFVVTSVGMVIIGLSSDKRNERKWHCTLCAVVSGVCVYLTSMTMDNLPLTVALLAVSSVGTYTCLPIFWTVPPTFLTGATRAAGIGVINAIGNLGGLVAPIIIGNIKDSTGSFQYALMYLGVTSIAGGILFFIICAKAHKNR